MSEYLDPDPDVVTSAPAPDATNPKDRIGQTKPQLHLVPASLGIRVSQAMSDGAKKYGAYNWRTKKVLLSVYISAAKRHLDSYFDGEDCARDSGISHLAHAAASIAIIIDALETGNLTKDRPPKGCAADLIDEITAANAAKK